ATLKDLAAARGERDNARERLRAALEADVAARYASLAALDDAMQRVDQVTDLVLDGAERAARLEAALKRGEEQKAGSARLADAEAELRRRLQDADDGWIRQWGEAKIAPRRPRDMAVWRKSVDEILRQRRDELEAASIEIETLRRKLDESRAPLSALVAELGGADAGLLPETLYREAEARAKDMQANWSRTCEAMAKREQTAKMLASAQKERARCAEEVARVMEAWPQALVEIGQRSQASVAEAKAALYVWRDVPQQRKEHDDHAHRVTAMTADIEAFEKAVSALVAAVASDLASRPARDALDAMAQRLKASGDARERRQALRDAAVRRERERARLTSRALLARGTVADARHVLDVAENTALAPLLERLARREECVKAMFEEERDLAESGDGLDAATLRSEQADIDADMLPATIARLEIAGQQLLADLQAAAKAENDAERAREDLAAGHHAARAAHEKNEAGAELLSIASSWLLRAGAARLAERAIERHRAAVEDPLLQRASHLFAIATDGRYARLGADFDAEDRPTLVAVTTCGEKTPVPALSEGARDQLFLALRLALLELRGGEPLPFIGDDLLASFDEQRTARALELLSEFGRTRQPIIFTHHRHVAEIAARLPAAADVIEL
ncbi:MAG TPA: hypothetical protein VED87_10555, partial [Methylocystis sp.]|nr:hypothetical protein [Methylocystis sp.]